jgi:hypothetical protein
MALFLRQVRGHPRVTDAFRVIHKAAGEEIEIGSIGLQTGSHQRQFWHWGIDTVLPRQPFATKGEARDRDDAMAQFRAVWEVFCSEPARLASFLEAKRAVRKAEGAQWPCFERLFLYPEPDKGFKCVTITARFSGIHR